MAKYSREALIKLLKKAVAAAPSGLQYAIGGATALEEHGYKRFTQDVDVFVLDEHLNPLMRALSGVGLHVFAIQEPSHYAAKIPGDPDPERRIDVLVPYAEPELSAIERAFVGKEGLRVFDANLLAMVKFYAYDDSGDVRHAFDLAAMHRRGIFDPSLVRAMMESVDPERVGRYDMLIHSFRAKGRPGPRPSKRLPPPTSE